MKNSYSLLGLSIALTTLITSLAFAQVVDPEALPVLPKAPPVVRIDAGAVQKGAETLNRSCLKFKVRHLKGRGLNVVAAQAQAKDFCFCVAKDVKRREDVREMSFLSNFYLDKIADDAKLSDQQGILLHELDKLEKNCEADPKYRFGMPEPRLESDPQHAPRKTNKR